MVCRGVGRREESRGVLGVAWDLVIMMLTVVGVAPALVVDGKRGRRREKTAWAARWPWAWAWAGSGWPRKEGDRGSWAACVVGPAGKREGE
jgi:hypothetical protein